MILRIILIISLIGLLVVGFSAAEFISIFHEGVKLLRERAKRSAQQRQHHRNTTQTVVDHRDADEIDKKIFEKDEGEYVEFEEGPVETGKQNQTEVTISLLHLAPANSHSTLMEE